MHEFERIEQFFAPLAGPEGLQLLDDAALIKPPPGHDLVMAKDMLVEGVHIPRGGAPAIFAQRAIRTNLSDIAAMGATPLGYCLGLALPPTVTDDWLAAFSNTLKEEQERFGCMLWGGDSVSSASDIMISMTFMGSVPAGQALRRSGAQAGDSLYVSGHIGDAAAGLQMVQGHLTPGKPSWRKAYEAPEPRLALGSALRPIAHATMDVSDGLIADIEHIAKASHLTAHIEIAVVPTDPDLPLDKSAAVTAGDDYELIFACDPRQEQSLFTLSESLDVSLTKIGRFSPKEDGDVGPLVKVYDANGAPIVFSKSGWRHSE